MNLSLIEFKNVIKKYGSKSANDNVSFCVKEASIHAIVGENGAGKSTSMKLLYGMELRDAGQILLRGEVVNFKSPRDAINRGIGMVHQHFQLVENLKAWENVVLGAEVPKKIALKKLDPITRLLKFDIPWDEEVEDLSVGVKQRIEIVKLLYRDAKILIFDEPTAVLAPQEVAPFFETLRNLRDTGRTILLITHKLAEVLSIADEITVMRRGKVTRTGGAAGVTKKDLASWIVGETGEELQGAPLEKGAPLLEVSELQVYPQKVNNKCSLKVHAGEIVGIAGIEGHGQSRLVAALAQVVRPKGEINLYAKSLGIVPEDRLLQAVVAEMSIEENFLLGHQKRAPYSKYGILSWKNLHREVNKNLKNANVLTESADLPLQSLSGGNQQKWVIARELSDAPELLIVSQPTRGVDIGAIQGIHQRLLAECRERKAGILLISSEVEELMALAHRILVLFEGEVVGEFTKGAFSINEIGSLMTCGAAK